MSLLLAATLMSLAHSSLLSRYLPSHVACFCLIAFLKRLQCFQWVVKRVFFSSCLVFNGEKRKLFVWSLVVDTPMVSCMQAVALFKSYFGGAFDEDAIRNNFVLIYELLDGKEIEWDIDHTAQHLCASL